MIELIKFLKVQLSIINLFHIYIRSTDINRTLMTANAVLQGLYSQTYHNDKLLSVWHPVPVHTVQAEKDKVKHFFFLQIIFFFNNLKCFLILN